MQQFRWEQFLAFVGHAACAFGHRILGRAFRLRHIGLEDLEHIAFTRRWRCDRRRRRFLRLQLRISDGRRLDLLFDRIGIGELLHRDQIRGLLVLHHDLHVRRRRGNRGIDLGRRHIFIGKRLTSHHVEVELQIFLQRADIHEVVQRMFARALRHERASIGRELHDAGDSANERSRTAGLDRDTELTDHFALCAHARRNTRHAAQHGHHEREPSAVAERARARDIAGIEERGHVRPVSEQVRARSERTAAHQGHQRTIAFLNAMTGQQQRHVRIGLDQLARGTDQRRMIVNRLERRDHADDEGIATDAELLAHFLACSKVRLEAHRIDAWRHDGMTVLRKTRAPMQHRGGFRGVDVFVGLLRKLRRQRELLAIDEPGFGRQRRRIARTPDHFHGPVASRAHEQGQELCRMTPALDHIGPELARDPQQLAHCAKAEASAREGDVVNRNPVLAQHCPCSEAGRQRHDLSLHAILGHPREQRHEQ